MSYGIFQESFNEYLTCKSVYELWTINYELFPEMWKLRIGFEKNDSIFISVFHRILDFKNEAEFLFLPLFF